MYAVTPYPSAGVCGMFMVFCMSILIHFSTPGVEVSPLIPPIRLTEWLMWDNVDVLDGDGKLISAVGAEL